MKFHWWWILVGLGVLWMIGWAISVIISVWFNPLDTEDDKRQSVRDRLVGQAIFNWILWPAVLPQLLDRRKLLRDMKTGKRPNWIMLENGEAGAREWKLADGTVFQASASTSGESSQPADITADYEDKSITGEISYRVRMIAPMPQPPTDWTRLKFLSDDPESDPEDEDDSFDRYQIKVKLPRGKYQVEFRVPNRTGKLEECAAVTLIISDPEDYNL